MKIGIKKLAVSIALAGLSLALTCCRTAMEENLDPMPAILRASTESGSASKTSMYNLENGKARVLWSELDQIGVFIDGSSRAETFTLETGAGTKDGVFRGNNMGSSYCAFYPVSMHPSMSGNNIRVTLPSTQAYTPGSFAPGSFPMAAASRTDDLKFRNVCSILRVSMTGYHPVTRIVFRAKDPSIKVCGKADISMDDPDEPLLTPDASGLDSLVMTVEGVTLNEEIPTDFDLVLPAQIYKKGFVVRVYTEKRYMDKEYPSDFTMKRSSIHKARLFEFEPNGLDVSSVLDGNGTENDPFLIQSIPDILLLRDAVRGGKNIKSSMGNSKSAAAAHYLLTQDLDFREACGANSKGSWKPVGTESYPFYGTFDGGGHMIEHLYIDAQSSSYQGLFGYVTAGGRIQNLSVSGTLKAYSYCGLVAGFADEGSFDNCFSDGDVFSGNGSFAGGIAGTAAIVSNCMNRAGVSGGGYVGGLAGRVNKVEDCINRGDVTGLSDVGGIAGCINLSGTFNCFNYGSVSGDSRIGGICGLHNAGVTLNCVNEGKVTGSSNVAGIAGYAHQQSKIANCVNRAEIAGGSYTGGICGCLSSRNARDSYSSIMNCVNTGAITLSGQSSHAGAICGFNEDDENYQSRVNNNYWLYDPSKQLGFKAGIGVNDGYSASNYALSYVQMKGTAYDVTLYGSYSIVFDALSSWACDNASFASQTIRPQGWKPSGEDSFPVLTGFDAVRPGSSQSVLQVTPSSFELSTFGEDFTVEVLSSLDYTITCPSWIVKGTVQSKETKPYVKQHSFRVAANKTTSDKEGEILIKDTEGTSVKVKVTQRGRYLDLDITDLVLASNGSSKTVKVSSSLDWVVSSSEDWCRVSPLSGRGDGILSVGASANSDLEARSALVTVSSTDGAIVRTLKVAQSGKKSGGHSDWAEREFVHKSVVMRFTATWCGWCPRMNKSVRRAQELYPGKISYLAIHGGGSDLQFEKADNLMGAYQVSGFPTGLVDCRTIIENYEIETTAGIMVSAVKETESKYGTLTGISISSSTSGRYISADVTAYIKKAGDYKLTVLLLEDGIVNYQADYEEGDHPKYVHDCVARMALTGIGGDAFSVEEDLSEESFHFTTTVPEAYNMDNMHILVYVQRKFGTYGRIQSNPSFGEYFVDNSAEVTLGDALQLALVGGGSGSGDSGGGGNDNEGILPGGDIDMN